MSVHDLWLNDDEVTIEAGKTLGFGSFLHIAFYPSARPAPLCHGLNIIVRISYPHALTACRQHFRSGGAALIHKGYFRQTPIAMKEVHRVRADGLTGLAFAPTNGL